MIATIRPAHRGIVGDIKGQAAPVDHRKAGGKRGTLVCAKSTTVFLGRKAVVKCFPSTVRSTSLTGHPNSAAGVMFLGRSLAELPASLPMASAASRATRADPDRIRLTTELMMAADCSADRARGRSRQGSDTSPTRCSMVDATWGHAPRRRPGSNGGIGRTAKAKPRLPPRALFQPEAPQNGSPRALSGTAAGH